MAHERDKTLKHKSANDLAKKCRKLQRAVDLATVFIYGCRGLLKEKKFNENNVLIEIDLAEETLREISDAIKGDFLDTKFPGEF